MSQFGGVRGFTEAEVLDNKDFWTLETEFVIPAALEGQINASNAATFFWSEEEINHRLERLMRDAYDAIARVAREHGVTLRTAAFIVACTRILQARQVRGLYA